MNSKKKVFLLHSQSPLEIYLSELAAYFKSKHFYQACSVAIICFAFFLRAILSRFSYSGKNIAPQFGDFEAQRHWLEITLHLPPAQ
ncbi:Glucosyltransferase-like protein, partial [Coelomomyces lativittatus]